MHVAAAITRLEQYQGRITALIDRTRVALDQPARDPVALATLRWEMLRLLREYQLFKHGELFDPLLRAADLGRRGRAASLKARCIEMAAAVGDHGRRWAEAGTATAERHADETHTLLTRLTQHLLRERLGVTELLSGLQRTRQA
ncbi:hypothetical protein [Sphingomonas bacterium]|uniref:hypothetical protein n=1 Tax=Sphingomonas bacterium TaxID=1895847 RepID=UPI0015751889|nr:hypothetical protein [Sphingomonas bacterium]